MMSSNFLYVAYRPEWGENRINDLLRQRGDRVETICPARGDPLPATTADYDGIIVGGALDDVIESSRRAYVEQLIALARACVAHGVPYLGLCFGAQVLAAAGGGRVLQRADGRGAFGYRPVVPVAGEGRDVFAGLDHACHLHHHGFQAPADAVRLASGILFPDSAFRLGPAAFGFQFHPEIRRDQIEAVVSHLGPAALERPGADPLARHLEDAARHDAGVHAWLQGFLERWRAADSVGTRTDDL